MKKILKKAAKIALIVAAITVYFNIGYAIGTYLNRLQETRIEQLTTFEKIVVCPDRFLLSYSERKAGLAGPMATSIAWPFVVIFLLFVISGSWLIYGCYLGGAWAVFQIWEGIKFLFLFICWGGLARLFGFA